MSQIQQSFSLLKLWVCINRKNRYDAISVCNRVKYNLINECLRELCKISSEICKAEILAKQLSGLNIHYIWRELNLT